MEISLKDDHIKKLNVWLEYYSDENKDATATGIYVGIKTVLNTFNLYYKTLFKEESVVQIEQMKIESLLKKMKENSINAMWNIGLASGICWTLELFGILDSDYSKCNADDF